jgi:hypothetical protein
MPATDVGLTSMDPVSTRRSRRVPATVPNKVQSSTSQHPEQALLVLGGEGGDGFVTVVAVPLLRLPVEVAIPAAITERNEEA